MFNRLSRWAAALSLVLASSLPLLGSAAEEGAQALDALWVKAMKSNDVDAVVKTYAPDAVAWLPGASEARGEKAIRAVFEGIMSANTVQDVVLSETEYRTMGNTSVGWGRFKLTLVPKAGGEPSVTLGRYIDVAEKRGDQWVYISDHASAEPPAAVTSGK
jgi:uncharacterized protein (TIGR02246 family)